ncbi:unnamed protein product [Peronospora destructor]|uniref:AMP-dependent synthetase/ligase domain-containing protein n=1 Tax=Peronospora destructor TaxID=86335 RepID=A0AAV0UQ94_9STRA|nr:unnamed protein product [Peronospora destructor]
MDDLASGLTRICGLKRQENLSPLYDTLGPDAVPFIANHTELQVLFCGMDQFHIVMDCREAYPKLKTIVQFEPVTDEQRRVAMAKNIELKSLSDLELIGRAEPEPADPPLPTDISTLCYTSGTTGDPKGVVLLHRNFTIVRDVLFLMEDLAELAPTLFVSVPRLFNRVYDKIRQGVAAGRTEETHVRPGVRKQARGFGAGYKTHALWDALIFAKLRQEFMKIVFLRCRGGGYGLSGTAAGVTLASGDMPLGPHVGPPLVRMQVCLEDVPDMGFTPAKTSLARVGGVLVKGCWNADGTLSIIDPPGEHLQAIEELSRGNCGAFDPEIAEAWGNANGLSGDHANVAQLIHNTAFKKEVLEDMAVMAKEAQLRGFECVKGVHFHPDPFSMDDGLITPTFKLKRAQLKARFQAEITHMYQDLQ